MIVYHGSTQIINCPQLIESDRYLDFGKGAVANDTIYQTLVLYEAGAYTVEDTIARLKVHRLFDQISFHTERALKEITFQKTISV